MINRIILGEEKWPIIEARGMGFGVQQKHKTIKSAAVTQGQIYYGNRIISALL